MSPDQNQDRDPLENIHLIVPPELLMAAKPILETFPGIWYVTPADKSVIICASDNYPEGHSGEWEDLPPVTIAGGRLLVHWRQRSSKARVSIDQPKEPEESKEGMLSLEQSWQLTSTRDDARFVELCEEWGFEVAGPSEKGKFLVLDNAGKAWMFAPLDARRLRDVLESVWTPFNVAYMNGCLYPHPSEGRERKN